MVVYDGEKWRMVRSRNIEGSWKERKDDDGNRIWDGLENIPNYFVTINGRVPKNMSGTGADTFELWPVKHNGNYRFSGRCRYHYDNSKGYYYSVKRYTYWDGRLHSHTRYYTTDQAINYLENRMYHTSRHHAEYLEHGKTLNQHNNYARPFFVPDDRRFVNARYRFYHPKHGRKHPNNW
jgi:hypothetical protein